MKIRVFKNILKNNSGSISKKVITVADFPWQVSWLTQLCLNLTYDFF